MSAAAPRGRPRHPDTEQAVARAAIELLAERGYAGATMDAIAARAGVGKPALYRRWGDRPTLLAAAFEAALAAANPTVPAIADVAAALRKVIRNLVRVVDGTPFGAALVAVVAELGREPALAQAAARVDARRRQLVEAVLVRARTEGRLRDGWTVELAADALLGAVYFRAWVRRRPLGVREIGQLVGGFVSDGRSAS